MAVRKVFQNKKKAMQRNKELLRTKDYVKEDKHQFQQGCKLCNMNTSWVCHNALLFSNLIVKSRHNRGFSENVCLSKVAVVNKVWSIRNVKSFEEDCF
jgi:hypothetical protein